MRIAQLPPSLQDAPWLIIYEITRICLHTGVPLADVKPPKGSLFHEYNGFWASIQDNPIFKGKTLPEKSSREAWKSALTGSEDGYYCIALSGSLQFNDKAQPLFQFRLEPIRFELSHRLGRRLGNHRFLELEVPPLSGQGLPKVLADLGDRGREIVVEWLVDTTHRLFGRMWKPFFNVKLKKKQLAETLNRVYFFAEDGNGIEASNLTDYEQGTGLFTMSVDALLNFIRPTRENKTQSYLKLFSRTALGIELMFNQLPKLTIDSCF